MGVAAGDPPGRLGQRARNPSGQVASLRQQGGDPAEDALIECTVAKGGASVLTDLHLVAGRATPAEARFAFCYGAVFLQLLDDLQDVASDLRAGHQTLATRAARRGRSTSSPRGSHASSMWCSTRARRMRPPRAGRLPRSDPPQLPLAAGRRDRRTASALHEAFRRSIRAAVAPRARRHPEARRRAIRRLQATARRRGDGRSLIDRLLLESS
jgi:hypothetical protein